MNSLQSEKLCELCNKDLDNNESIFSCDKCEFKIHQACYIYSSDELKMHKITSCDTCRVVDIESQNGIYYSSNSEKFKCVLCQCNDQNAKIKIRDNLNTLRFSHIRCIEWLMKKGTLNKENNFYVFTFKSYEDIVNSISQSCCICKKKDTDFNMGSFKIRCQDQKCKNFMHTYCLDKNSFSDLGDKIKNRKAYCLTHSIFFFILDKEKKAQSCFKEKQIIYYENQKEYQNQNT